MKAEKKMTCGRTLKKNGGPSEKVAPLACTKKLSIRG